ncbi:MAG TPA: hypothetical protein DD381_05855 [Lentisphaeria bacterium]|nr:MAG: hypothetical protein A2X47_08255 [Lentisphaerae bacterium GWF2_38_69]HBM15849.1 hypothetical protein [Lentisphaeria bacterium]
MTVLQEIENKAYKLPLKERGKLIHNLIASIDNASQDYEAYDKEIKRRVSAIRSGKAVGIPAEEVFSKIASSFSK